MKMKINLDYYIILCDLFESIPLRTPKRLEIIYGFAKDLIISKEENKTTSNDNIEIIIDMHDESYFRDSPFSLNIDSIARIEQNKPKMKTFVSRQKHEFEKVFLPNLYYCCEKLITIRDNYAKISVYDVDGIYTARSYHGKCKVCKISYYYGFQEERHTGKRVFCQYECNVLLFNSATGFAKTLLILINNMICIGGISFEKAAQIYDNSISSSNTLNPDRLETAWFVFPILDFVESFPSWP